MSKARFRISGLTIYMIYGYDEFMFQEACLLPISDLASKIRAYQAMVGEESNK